MFKKFFMFLLLNLIILSGIYVGIEYSKDKNSIENIVDNEEKVNISKVEEENNISVNYIKNEPIYKVGNSIVIF